MCAITRGTRLHPIRTRSACGAPFVLRKAVAANANPISSLGNYIVPTSTHLPTGLRDALAIVRHAQRLQESAFRGVANERSNQPDRQSGSDYIRVI